jgi:hypothetical protein
MPWATSALFSFRGFYGDGLLGKKEAIILLKKLSALLAEKWEKPYLFRSLRLYQCANEHRHRQSNPYLYPWISYSDEQNEQSPPVVGGQSRPQPISTLVYHNQSTTDPSKSYCLFLTILHDLIFYQASESMKMLLGSSPFRLLYCTCSAYSYFTSRGS